MDRIVIRCDGSPAIGAGHVSRSLALADALGDYGLTAAFAMFGSADSAAGTVRAAGHVVCDGAAGADGPGVLAANDVDRTIDAARAAGAGAVIVDHYGAAPDYFRALADAGLYVGVIDDLADRDLGAARWLLNQNLGADQLTYALAPGAVALLGPRYALLRRSFGEARARLRRTFTSDARRLLVTLGGGDTDAACASVLASLGAATRRLTVRAVARNPSDRLRAAAGASPHDVEILPERRPEEMAAHMAWADVAVCAGGVTTWELCCLGVPMIVAPGSPDQRRNAAALAREGLAVDAGAPDQGARTIGQLVRDLLDDTRRRSAMSAGLSALVDGRGAWSAAASLAGVGITA